ncbi:MAG: GAF domain-containing protein [Bacillaceae bacterium]|nr:GAF domain-containing protein [Bacillaceae bacterium]
MSIATDVASLQIMAEVYKKKSLQETFEKTVKSLVKEVEYIDWVGIYMVQDNKHKLAAASDFGNTLTWEANAELKFPILNSIEQQIGVMVVKSKQAICFDVTDVATLETIASGLGQISLSN